MQDTYQCPLNWEDGHEGIPWLEAKIDEDEDLETVQKFNHAKKWDSDHFPVLGMFDFRTLEVAAQPLVRPFLVDVGGGQGGPLMQIRRQYPVLVRAGRWVLQTEEAAAVSKSGSHGLFGVDVQEHNFFSPQPVKGSYLPI